MGSALLRRGGSLRLRLPVPAVLVLVLALVLALAAGPGARAARPQRAGPGPAGSAAAAAGPYTPPNNKKQKPFDYFVFVQEWAGTFCQTKRCYQEPEEPKFTIHGLWPNYNSGGYPAFCDKSKKFDPAQVADLRDAMDADWMSYPQKDSTSFWKHEWEKHGTCSAPSIASEHEYFAQALALYGKLDILGALERAGITPGTRAYPTSDVARALEDATGSAPILQCSKGQINEVWFCVSKGLEVYSCGEAELAGLGARGALGGESKCSSSVKIPEIKHQEAGAGGTRR